MTILFAGSRFEALERGLLSVEREILRIWLSSMAMIGAVSAGTKNGHPISSYEETISGVFREIIAPVCSDVPIVFEEDIFTAWAPPSNGMLLIDPVDGTHNLLRGYPGVAASLCYLEDGEPVFGWVLDIARQTSYLAARGMGSFRKNQIIWARNETSNCTSASQAWVATMRGPGEIEGARSFGKTRRQSNFALECVLISAGHLDGFVDFSSSRRHKVCDVVAPSLILREAGGALFDKETGAQLSGREICADLNKRFNVIASATQKLGDELCKTTTVL